MFTLLATWSHYNIPCFIYIDDIRILTFPLSGRFHQTTNWLLFCYFTQALIVHANCLLRRQSAWNSKACFRGKIRKIFQNVVCWTFFTQCAKYWSKSVKGFINVWKGLDSIRIRELNIVTVKFLVTVRTVQLGALWVLDTAYGRRDQFIQLCCCLLQSVPIHFMASRSHAWTG